MPTGHTITRAHIDDLIARSVITDTKLGEKTTVVCLKLPNGFEVVESSGCVDPANYDHAMGRKICLERIVGRVWQLEGYRLQCVGHAIDEASKRMAPEVGCPTLVRTTTDGKPPAPGMERAGAPQPINPATGQHGAYYVLSEEERAKGFVRKVRRSYVHKKCGTLTTMSQDIAETYARDPKFYGRTFCCGCRTHKPVAEFTWDGTTEEVGS
jgi:hypothetical protein